MNQPNEKEIDLLLRRHARRGETDAANTSGNGSPAEVASHLDADELNAYAENALPPRTRARYATHLADCADCRKIVTGLALSANVPLKEESLTGARTLERKSWSEWLAALFSSPVLRFGTLALLLLVVAGAALIVMQQKKNRGEALIAQNTKPRAAVEEEPSLNHASSSAAEQTTTATSNASSANVAVASGRTASQSEPQFAPDRADEDQRGDATPNAKAQAAPQSGGLVAGNNNQSVNGQRETAQAQNQPPPASTNQSTFSAGTTAANDTDEMRASRASESERQEENSRRGGSAALSSVGPTAGGAAPSPPPAQTRTQSAARRRARSETVDYAGDTTKNTVDASETRSVAGHRFRRQGSAWVDAAYNSSMSTTTVSRGSDRYRALVADAPEIRTIAEQLGGEIIVVWGGKAYRIK